MAENHARLRAFVRRAFSEWGQAASGSVFLAVGAEMDELAMQLQMTHETIAQRLPVGLRNVREDKNFFRGRAQIQNPTGMVAFFGTLTMPSLMK